MKSGGPKMVIKEIGKFGGLIETTYESAKCEWFDPKSGKQKEDVFALTSLVLAEPLSRKSDFR